MRRPTPTELNALRFIARNGSYSPESDAMAEPGIMDVLKSLERKKRAYRDPDADVLTFRLTQWGRNQVGAVDA